MTLMGGDPLQAQGPGLPSLEAAACSSPQAAALPRPKLAKVDSACPGSPQRHAPCDTVSRHHTSLAKRSQHVRDLAVAPVHQFLAAVATEMHHQPHRVPSWKGQTAWSTEMRLPLEALHLPVDQAPQAPSRCQAKGSSERAAWLEGASLRIRRNSEQLFGKISSTGSEEAGRLSDSWT